MVSWRPRLISGGGYEDGAGGAEARDVPAGAFVELAEENEHLRQLVKLQGELVASVAHDLRTPLASVLGFTQLLLRRKVPLSESERYLRIIEAEMRRFTGLIEDLYDAQLIAQGRNVLCLELFDLRGLLREQVDLFRGQSDRHELRLDLPEQPLLVHADAERIARVIANLLSNAIKYSPGGGVISVTAEQRDDNVRVSIGDTGIGIPFDRQHLVFARFFRADTSSPGTKGVGLGLALCREIVDAHEGALGFDSIEGDGSTFWFELREYEPAATPSPVFPPTPPTLLRSGCNGSVASIAGDE